MPSFRSPHALAAPARLRGRRRSPINAPLDQQGPDNASRLVGQGHGDQHLRLARQHPRQPRARWCAALTGPADHRTRAEDEQTPDGPLAHLRDCAEPLLAASRFLQGRQPEPGGEVAPGPEALRRGHEGRDRGGRDRTDARDRHQPARHGVGLRARGDLGIQRLDLRLQAWKVPINTFRTARALSGTEESGTEFVLKADLTFIAIGFAGPEKQGLLEEAEVDLDSRGNVRANDRDYRTSNSKVFVAGDM